MGKIKILETISETPYSRVSYCYLDNVKAVLKTKNIYFTSYSKKEIHDLIPKKFEIIRFEEHMYADKIKNDVILWEFDIITRLKK